MLAAHLAEHEPGADGPVFTARRGARPVSSTSLNDAWRKARRLAELPEVRFHDLRHHYASALIHAGASVKVVQERLGHASPTETLEVYAHLWPGSDDATREAISAAWADSPVPISYPSGVSG